MKSAKILGVTVRNDLNWNDQVDNITANASRGIYLLKHLKHAGIDCKSLTLMIWLGILTRLNFYQHVYNTFK